jgi:HAD superfamily hydrolase (TIGR01490 family)
MRLAMTPPPMSTLALFDLDHTLIPLDSDYAWGQFLVQVGAVDAASFAADNQRLMDSYNAGTLTAAQSLPILLAPLAAHPRTQLDAWHKQFMAQTIAPALTAQAAALLARHVNQGHTVLIVTATNRFVTAPIAAALGVPNSHLIATEPEADARTGQFTGRWVGEPSFKAGKISRVNDWLGARGQALSDFAETWFYSDSSNDLPLLEAVTHPVACNPSAGLAATAMARGWRIQKLWD